MRRRRRLPPDTRPKWDDPDLENKIHIYARGADLGTIAKVKLSSEERMRFYDSLPRADRDFMKHCD